MKRVPSEPLTVSSQEPADTNSAPPKSDACEPAPANELTGEARAFLDGAVGPNTAVAISRPVGRPNTYTTELGAAICEEIGKGIAIVDIFGDERFPSKTTFYRWLHEYPELDRQYRFALHSRAETYADEMLEITRNWDRLYVTQIAENQQEGAKSPILNKVIDKNAIAALDRQIDALKYRMVKDNPRKYADLPPLIDQPAAPGNGDGAKLVNPQQQVIEADPCKPAIEAFFRARAAQDAKA